MKIISVDKNIIRKLRESGVSTKMKSLESCDWVVLYEENGIIGGAAGMGGMFNVSGIQLNENFRGKGYGKISHFRMCRLRRISYGRKRS